MRSSFDNPSRPLLFATLDRLGTPNRMNRRQFGHIAAAAAALPFTPVLAQRVDKYAEQLTNGEFNWYPRALGERSDHRHRLAARSAGVCLSQWGPHRRFVVLDRQTRPPNPDRRVQDPAEGQEPPFLDLQQRVDALHEPAHLVWHRPACGPVAGLPASHGCVRLPKEFRRASVWRHQTRHDRGHRRRQVTARRSDASRHGAWRICRARIQRGRHSDQGDRIFGRARSRAEIAERRHQQRRQVDPGVRQWRVGGIGQGRDPESGEAARRACVHAERRRRSVRSSIVASRRGRSDRRRHPRTTARLCAASRRICRRARPFANGSNSA